MTRFREHDEVSIRKATKYALHATLEESELFLAHRCQVGGTHGVLTAPQYEGGC